MKRIVYIDSAKGYLMLCVVVGHVLITLNPEYGKLYYTAPRHLYMHFLCRAFSLFTVFYLMLKSGKDAAQKSSLFADCRH